MCKAVISQCSSRRPGWRRRRSIWKVSLLKSLGSPRRKSASCRGRNSKLIGSGQHDLEEPIAVRPTSETVMYPCKLLALNRT